MLYKDFLTFWLENYVKPDTKFRTYLRYSQIVRITLPKKSENTICRNLRL